jgi:16S rRNA (cytosine967-C5)-methyltransferase
MISANPRRAAFDILHRIEKERSFADILIDRAVSSGALKGPDRGLLTELVYGVLRRQGTLDHVINQFSRQKTERLERNVLILLRLGLYQLLYLDRIPVSAAVNETVELAKALAPRASGLVNALLRRADRERDAIRYPDPVKEPVAYLAARYSHPQWIVKEWLEQLGREEAKSLASAMVEPPPLTLRANTLKLSRDQLIARLAESGVTAAPLHYSPVGAQVTTRVPLASLAEFREGLCTIQDESSQLAAIFLAPKPGERVLDLCAAPGGKATHLAQIMENRGSITACDSAERKLALIDDNAKRLQIGIIRTVHLDAGRPLSQAMLERLGAGSFDRILVDAPCSGMGVIRRNPDGKWWKSSDDLGEITHRQKAILAGSADLLDRQGLILYATCSTSRKEDEEVVADFLSKRPDFVLEDLREHFPEWGELFTDTGCFRGWPHRHGMDGFFAARLRRIR